ncbi:MAG TPA: YCF48-related protein, partial [Gammaproteobacteria bacterium]
SVTGQPNGGLVLKVLVDPVTPSTLYACANGGFFKSTDGGASWSLSLSVTNQAYDAAIEPENPSTLYVASDTIYKSTDAGKTWTAVENGIGTISSGSEQDYIQHVSVDPVTDGTAYATSLNTGLYKTTDGGKSWSAINTGLTSLIGPDTQFGQIVVDPVNPQNLYVSVGTSTTSENGIYKSTDGGSHWTAAYTGVYAGDVVVDPHDDTHLFAVINFAVDMSTSSGASGSWTALSASPAGAALVRIDPTNSQNLFVSTGEALYYSTNGGTSWTEGANNTSFTISDIAIDPVTDNNLYISTSGLGLYKSTDGGQTLAESDSGLHGVAGISQMVMGSDGAMYIGSDASGVFKSTDLGVNWSSVNNGLGLTGSVASIYALVEDPQTPATLYAGSPNGLFKTTNGGASWTLQSNGKTDAYTYAVAIDPENSKNVYAGTTSGGVFKSMDAGSSWQSASIGLPVDLIRSLAVDPTNGNIVYAGTEANGLYRSTDGGAHWSADNTGLQKLSIRAIAIDPANSQNVYLSLINGGIYKSTDGGNTWAAANTAITQTYLYPSLIVDPTRTATLYAVPFGIGEDMYVTTDAGMDWQAITPFGLATSPVQVTISAAALDPQHPQNLYGAASDGRIYGFSSVTPTTKAGSVTTTVNTAASGQLSATLSGAGGILDFAIASPPAHGTVTITDATSGTFTYTPTSNFSGSDSFTFTVSAAGAVSAPTTESITVTSSATQTSSGGGSGGGGALSCWALLLLVSLTARRSSQRADCR